LRPTRLAALLDVAATPLPSATRDGGRNSNLVHPGVTPLRAGDQDVANGTKSNGSANPNDSPSRDGDHYDLNDARDIEAAIILCTAMGRVLSTWEKRFVWSMAEYNESCYPTDKQLAVLAPPHRAPRPGTP
jgi:hypothetical protein